MADSGGAGYGMVNHVPAEVHDRRGGLTADRVSFLPVASPKCDRSLGNEDDEHTREVDMPRRGIAVAVIVIVACFIVLGLTSDFLVDWAWFSAIGYLDVFGTILGGKAVLFFAVFAGSAIFLWVNGSLASRFARRRRHVHPVDFERESEGVQTLPELLELMRQRLPWRLLIAGVAGVLAILLAAGEVSNWDVFKRFVYQVPYGLSDPQYGKDIGFYLFSLPAYVVLKSWMLLTLLLGFSRRCSGVLGARRHRIQRAAPVDLTQGHRPWLRSAGALLRGESLVL